MTIEKVAPGAGLPPCVPVFDTAGTPPAHSLSRETLDVASKEEEGAARRLLALGWRWKSTESGAWGLFPAWVGGEVRRG